LWGLGAPGVIGGIGLELEGGNSTVYNAGTISGGGLAAIAFIPIGVVGHNTLTLAPTSVISGLVLGSAAPAFAGFFAGGPGDTLQLGGTGAGTFDISQLSNTGQYEGFGFFNKVDSSTWTLIGTSSFAGPIAVNGGTLAVNGDITSASSLTVNAGGTLGGTGIVGSTQINGGTLAPGNPVGTLTISGSLTMTAASTYLVQISGATAGNSVISGAASIAGRVLVDPLTRLGQTTTYTILTAGAVTGTFRAQRAAELCRRLRIIDA
jgi:autotransporter-associated beta strand protein